MCEIWIKIVEFSQKKIDYGCMNSAIFVSFAAYELIGMYHRICMAGMY